MVNDKKPKLTKIAQKPKKRPASTRGAVFAARLEDVRLSAPGQPDIKTFWRQVKRRAETLGRGRDVPTYAAARMYHIGREAPAPYLALVAETFGVRLWWLVTGEGPRTEAEGVLTPPHQTITAVDTIKDQRLGEDRWLDRVGTMRDALLFEAYESALLHARVRLGAPMTFDEGVFWAARVGEVLGLPLRAFDVSPGQLDRARLSDYVTHMCLAIKALEPQRQASTPTEEPSDGEA